MYYIALYCTALHCTVLYCTVLYCTVLHCTVLYCTVLYCTVLYCTALHCTVLYCTVLHCTVLYCTVCLPGWVRELCLLEVDVPHVLSQNQTSRVVTLNLQIELYCTKPAALCTQPAIFITLKTSRTIRKRYVLELPLTFCSRWRTTSRLLPRPKNKEN